MYKSMKTLITNRYYKEGEDAQLLETMAAVMEEVCESDLALTQ